MTFPINMESHKNHVPNHQPDIYIWVSENRLPLNPLDDHHFQHIFSMKKTLPILDTLQKNKFFAA